MYPKVLSNLFICCKSQIIKLNRGVLCNVVGIQVDMSHEMSVTRPKKSTKAKKTKELYGTATKKHVRLAEARANKK